MSPFYFVDQILFSYQPYQYYITHHSKTRNDYTVTENRRTDNEISKRTNNDIIQIHYTKKWIEQHKSHKLWGELVCFRTVSSSCSTRATLRVTLVANALLFSICVMYLIDFSIFFTSVTRLFFLE